MTCRRNLNLSFVVLFAAAQFTAQGAVDSVDAGPAFSLVNRGIAAPIVLPANAPEVVGIAARDLAADIAEVSGVKPEVVTSDAAQTKTPRIELLLAPPKLAGRWEAFQLSCSSNVLTIAGSDRRGLAFGIYEISRRIGVSPWHWWADVPVTKRPDLRLSLGQEPVDQPAVKYRGIFINDEDWGLQPWAAKTYEPEVGNLGPKTYARVFELLLRLRANCLWPAMHPTTRAFHAVPGNAAVADSYAIVLGSSHAEPMLRNNVDEWKEDAKRYNYLTNRAGVLAYWEQRVKERTNGESLFTIGMRGIHDSPIVGPKTQPERIATLETIFDDQRNLLAKHLGHGTATNIGQIFCPYKEVLDDYNAGLRVPEDVTLVWPDDNFGYIRRYATPAERARVGGQGVYYHASYLGMPFAWTWIDTMSPALIWSEMTRAYEQGARKLWVVNVGDIKNTERSMEFFLDLAWHADRTDANAPATFLSQTAARDFGPANAAAVADILSRLHALNFARKTEFLQWHLSKTPYRPTELNEAEIKARLKACAELLRDSDALAECLPAAARDACFELVGYPVGITAAANERYFRAELAHADAGRGRPPEANLAAAQAGEKRVAELTARYNNNIAGGKWRNIVTADGISLKEWGRFQREPAPRPEPATNNICPAAPSEPTPLARPSDAHAGEFVERDGRVSIHAGHFTGKQDAADGAGWRSIPGLGRTGSAVTVMPSTAVIASNASPSLEYRFHVVAGGLATVRVRLLPTFPIVGGRGLRLAIAVDDGAPLPLAVTTGFDTKHSNTVLTGWQRRVLENATEAVLALRQPLSPGAHTLRLIAVDAGVVADKIVIEFGARAASYDGPVETRLPVTAAAEKETAKGDDLVSQAVVDVWPAGKMPGQGADEPETLRSPERTDAKRITNVSRPTLTVFPADGKGAAKAPAMIVCPGGGYGYVVFDKEGTDIARWLNTNGMTALVLKYRVPNNRDGALQDLQRALRVTRAHAAEWNIDPGKLGVIGFSAGGNLAARASNLFGQHTYAAIDDVDRQSARPDFAVLVYPAYLEHGGELATNLDLTAAIPPTLIIHNDDDEKYILGSRLYHAVLNQAGVTNEFRCFASGGHGYGLRSTNAVGVWPEAAWAWMGRILSR
ncbi:MAG: glycosyl hydrolase 115 family protein [Verrucomicrobiota bacterium]